ncbi:uncharacterized protein LOC111065340 [Drosophila obscura]|uniref:uncharacterized protein LOC111065340 n=1 Tax=Drosophila obscura TaxID=7282 RepID=UPI000BA08550|nr:uncharacterized protein LOC111065340 [Drosophila obscura]
MANGIEKGTEDLRVIKSEKFESELMDNTPLSAKRSGRTSPSVTPYLLCGTARRRSLSGESSTDSSDSNHTWDHKRGGVNSKRLHKVRAAAMRREVRRSRSSSSSSNASESPSNENVADAVLVKGISPATKRIKVAPFASKLGPLESGTPKSGADTNNKGAAEIKQLSVINLNFVGKPSEINGNSRAANEPARRVPGKPKSAFASKQTLAAKAQKQKEN